jgi:hypothetical protein
MTALTEPVPVAQTGDRPRPVPVRPGRVLVTIIGAFFFAIGWATGITWRGLALAVPYMWRGLVFAGKATRYGYWRGLGMSDEQIEAMIEAAAKQQGQKQPVR